jgi:hypothetical protein
MRIEDKEAAHEFKKYISEALAKYQIEHNLEIDNLRNWFIACRYYNDYFDLSNFKI